LEGASVAFDPDQLDSRLQLACLEMELPLEVIELE